MKSLNTFKAQCRFFLADGHDAISGEKLKDKDKVEGITSILTAPWKKYGTITRLLLKSKDAN